MFIYIPTCVPTLAVLLGPVRMITYLLMHGLYAVSLAALWSLRCPWWLSIPAAAAVRLLGTVGYIAVTSWTLNENFFALILAGVFSLLDQILAMLGVSGAPSLLAVQVTMASLFAVNCLFYVLLMHCMYEVILRQLGYDVGLMPSALRRVLYRDSSLA